MTNVRYQIGDRIANRFRVMSIHNGYLGIVYICRAIDGQEPRHAAIKTFRFNEEVCRGLFERELRNWVKLPAHPNLVFAFHADNEEKLLLLEFVRGPSLNDVSKKRPGHPKYFVRWANDIARGLRFLHLENAFLHRDLRPANVLLDLDGDLRAKISDLGLGKPYDPESSSHTTIGTFNYMAPEIFDRKTDFRSDIFSYGATLYFILTGKVAVKRSTRMMDQVDPPSLYRPDTPSAVEQLILRCMAREPADRPSSMDEVLDEVSAFEPWDAGDHPFTMCDEHSYPHSTRFGKELCPVCLYVRDFERREQVFNELPPSP